MLSEFEIACKHARAQIEVPPVPLSAIRDGGTRRIEREYRRRFVAVTTLVALSTAAVAAATIADRAHISFTKSGGMVLSSQNLRLLSPASVKKAVAAADFPATIPSGLPPGARLEKIVLADKSVIALQYTLPGWRLGDDVLTFFLLNPSEVKSALPASYAQKCALGLHSPRFEVMIWRVGGEAAIVVANQRAVSAAQLAKIKASMLKERSP